MNDENRIKSIDQAIKTILKTWTTGKKCLIVYGAGVSTAANIPLMSTVYSDLAKRVKKHLNGSGKTNLLDELAKRLDALSRGDAPRSIAAMSLGSLQKAYEHNNKSSSKYLEEIWREFSNDFIEGKLNNRKKIDTNNSKALEEINTLQEGIKQYLSDLLISEANQSPEEQVAEGPLRDRTPTLFHKLIAKWAEIGFAYLVSVNFDGLTKKAIDNILKDKGKAVVLSEPNSVKKYFLGEDKLPSNEKIIPVIKVWGDVFHSICTNPRCPESGNRVPIFQLEEDNNYCNSCGRIRQLQIFFTGYEEKEKNTQNLMKEILKYVGPQIGCVLSIGFSGLWDQTLVELISLLCLSIEQEFHHKANETISCICIDTSDDPSFIQEISRRGIEPLHLKIESEDFAKIFYSKDSNSQKVEIKVQPYNGDVIMKDEMWEKWINERKYTLPFTYQVLASQTNYLAKFRRLRQLGIKTRVSLAANRPIHDGKTLTPEELTKKEISHNRLQHSRGAAHLALPWFHSLSSKLPNEALIPNDVNQCLATVILFAATHHDIGHLPFTHLTEEIFEELHWNLRDWGKPFRHDEPILAMPFRDFENDIKDTFNKACEKIKLDYNTFQSWVESAIQGCSGFHWVDAILNSPLDVDKLDYVFRDCEYLNQGLHIARSGKDKWMKDLFGQSRVLPSGLVALEGVAGEHAQVFLEERIWLYKNQYFQQAFRALERIARSVVIQWLLMKVPSSLGGKQATMDLKDTSCLKGIAARELLWKSLSELEESKGEPDLLLKIVDDLTIQQQKGLIVSEKLTKWAERCKEIFEKVFAWPENKDENTLTLYEYLVKEIRITCSMCFYSKFENLRTIREIIREIETQRTFRALFDIVIPPRVLSYPSRRRFNWQGEDGLSECFAVAHYDPDRWGMSTNKWIPMSESAFAEKDRSRWIRIMVVSPWSEDSEVWHAIDRFRKSCQEKGITIKETDPENKLL